MIPSSASLFFLSMVSFAMAVFMTAFAFPGLPDIYEVRFLLKISFFSSSLRRWGWYLNFLLILSSGQINSALSHRFSTYFWYLISLPYVFWLMRALFLYPSAAPNLLMKASNNFLRKGNVGFMISFRSKVVSISELMVCVNLVMDRNLWALFICFNSS